MLPECDGDGFGAVWKGKKPPPLALSLLSLVSLLSSVAVAKEDSLLNPRPDHPTIEKTTIEHTAKDARRLTRRRAFRGVSR